MVRAFVILVLAALASSQTGDKKSPPNLNESDNARKARAVLDKTIDTLGGQAYLTYQDKTEEGRYYPMYHGHAGSVGIPYARYSKYPDKDRFEVLHMRSYYFYLFSVGDVKIKDKSDIVLIHNGDKGYETTYKGTAMEDAADTATYLRRRRHSLDWALRMWINEPGVAFFYDGTAVVDAKAADQVTLVNAQNDSVTLYIDQNSHLPLKTSYTWRDPQDKQRNIEEEVFDNFKPVQGIMAPHSITRFFNGDMSNQRFIAVAAFNQKVPDSAFEASVTYDPMKGPAKH